jgi:predicted O-linked N-acetylglucosamine transferase (SPINDLY family)
MAEFLAGDADAYVATAAALAADRARLAARRGELRRRLEASPLMDARGLARRVEAAFRALRRG